VPDMNRTSTTSNTRNFCIGPYLILVSGRTHVSQFLQRSSRARTTDATNKAGGHG
jgi:hypothetical protein